MTTKVDNSMINMADVVADSTFKAAVAHGHTLTVSGTSGGATWTTQIAKGVYYMADDGTHRLRFNISGAFNGNITSATMAITGVVFDATYRQALAAANAAASWGRAMTTKDTNQIEFLVGSADATVFISGDVLLKAAPTF